MDGDPCVAGVTETAVRFDEGPFNKVPVKAIDRAVLTYGEAAAPGCTWPTGSTCWRSGSGAPEPKPNGCVATLAFPTVDWTSSAPAGLLPHTIFPQVKRTTPREWDVSVPYSWQYMRTAPLGGAPPPPFGFLLSGGVALNQLELRTTRTARRCCRTSGELHVTYTIPPDRGGVFVPPR